MGLRWVTEVMTMTMIITRTQSADWTERQSQRFKSRIAKIERWFPTLGSGLSERILTLFFSDLVLLWNTGESYLLQFKWNNLREEHHSWINNNLTSLSRVEYRISCASPFCSETLCPVEGSRLASNHMSVGTSCLSSDVVRSSGEQGTWHWPESAEKCAAYVSFYTENRTAWETLCWGHIRGKHHYVTVFWIEHVLLMNNVASQYWRRHRCNTQTQQQRIFCWHLAGIEFSIVQTARRMKTKNKTPLCSPTKPYQSGEKLIESLTLWHVTFQPNWLQNDFFQKKRRAREYMM